ncbi:hypothetical protein F0919_12855 [Taibaiella lutea]|uniref:Uncharacterized protein n=1 Tax=Taibaiella lutea TaxID=2608001 RepID=A0A5M6CJ68_9BACT|nr:hypothetical protein [Taibaiella lutea]KAA5533425.1 hypothetical protein F0919_12855 [Taibaiella lutea]
MDSKYYVTKRCKKCENQDRFYLTKKEKAFELFDLSRIRDTPCTNCYSKEYLSIGGDLIELDKELFLEWAFDLNLQFMEQDEDLLIAEKKYIDIILDLIDNYEILNEKKIVLIEALCTIVYDNLKNQENKGRLERQMLIDNVVYELRKRREQVFDVRASIFGYIKDVVFPLIKVDKE